MGGKAKLQAVFYTHRTLWSVLEDLRGQLDRTQSVRSLGLATLLLAHNCFEAYLNYAGETLLPDLWADERRVFGSAPYRGLMGKLRRLADELSIPIDHGRRPYSTVRKLKTWRDGVVHPRIEKLERVVSFEDPKYLKNIETQFFRSVKPVFIDRAIEDVQALCDSVEARAHMKHPAKFLSRRAFKGILGTTGGSLL